MMLCFLGTEAIQYSQGTEMQGIPIKRPKINKFSIQKAEKIKYFKTVLEKIAALMETLH